jgi:hypothetical protein
MARSRDAPVSTGDDVKPDTELVDDVEIPKVQGAGSVVVPSQFESAVGYKEYLEAVNLDVSEKEVGALKHVRPNLAQSADLPFVAK